MSVRVAGLWGPPTLYDALKAEGFELPPECGDITLDMPVDGVAILHMRRQLTHEDLVKVGRALASVGAAGGKDLK